MEDLLNEVLEQENIVNDPEEVIDIEESINEFKREEIKLNEGKQDNFTDVSILSSNDINDKRNIKSIDIKGENLRVNSFQSEELNLSNFNRTILWSNKDTNIGFDSQDIDLTDDINNYDYLLISLKCDNTREYVSSFIISKDFVLETDGEFYYPKVVIGNFSYSGPAYARALYKIDNNTLHFTKGLGVGSTNEDINVMIPEKIEGLKVNLLGGNITNNYYCTVSDDSLSYNMLNKPLNKYTTGESYIAFGTLMFLGIGLYLIIRRSIFKWH